MGDAAGTALDAMAIITADDAAAQEFARVVERHGRRFFVSAFVHARRGPGGDVDPGVFPEGAPQLGQLQG